jgi:hypothetical protein
MLKGLGAAANAVVLVLLIVTVGSLSLIKIETQPIFQVLRNVMLAALGEETKGVTISGDGNQQRLECDFRTGTCNWR